MRDEAGSAANNNIDRNADSGEIAYEKICEFGHALFRRHSGGCLTEVEFRRAWR